MHQVYVQDLASGQSFWAVGSGRIAIIIIIGSSQCTPIRSNQQVPLRYDNAALPATRVSSQYPGLVIGLDIFQFHRHQFHSLT